MAQGGVATMPPVNGSSLTAVELREILEYEKIVKFKDAVLAGTHPRIKIPSYLQKQPTSSTRDRSSPAISTPSSNNVARPPPSTNATRNDDHTSSYYISLNNNRTAASANGQIVKSGNSEIDPIFLTKSDDLIKAEMMLQRQRLERSLREQMDEQRQKSKALLQTSESLPNFDISEVLLKAQALVNPSPDTSAQRTTPAMATGDTPADASDSFDENSFYSSQHDSSQWSNSSQSQKEPGEVQSDGIVSADARSGELPTANDRAQQAINSLPSNNQIAGSTQTTQPLRIAATPLESFPGLGMASHGGASSIPTNTGSRNAERDIQGAAQSAQFGTAKSQFLDQATVHTTTDELIRRAFNNGPDSPVMRVHNLSPLAPQPARVSPLVATRDAPILRDNMHANEAHPAQVMALRNNVGGMSSTDSSPKGNKRQEKVKGKGKKKKRKAQDDADSPDSVYIKPEPKSPSPYTPVAPLPRPQKRPRQSGQYAAELNYDDQPRYQPHGIDLVPGRERFAEPQEGRQRGENPYEPEFRRPDPGYRRLEEEAPRRVTETFVQRPPSPRYSTAYPGDERRVPTRAVSYAGRPEEPRHYKEPGRAIVRIDADRERSRSPIMREPRSPAMAAPRQPIRIIRDEHGREYIDPDPPQPSYARQSVARPSRYREEVVYERAPISAVPRRAMIEYEEDGVMYRRVASPMSAVPRRVMTQPEYAMPPPAEYRSYREREYSVRPTAMGPPGEEFAPSRAAERRVVSQYDEAPREYVSRTPIAREGESYSRAVSVRPEPVRYEVRGEAPREYSRAPNVRPEVVRYQEAPREYGRDPSVRPEAVRYEEASREYGRAPSVRPEPVRYEAPREYARSTTIRPETVRYETREEPYGPRATTVRPDARYEAPHGYVVAGARPEAPPREYASSVRPEARREMIPQGERGYSVRPMEAAPLRREFVAAPGGEVYYGEPPRRGPVEVEYSERPRLREESAIVYADDPRGPPIPPLYR